MGNSSQGIGSFLVAKRTISTKEILADIKAGMDDAGLMEKYWLSGKISAKSFREARRYGRVEGDTTWRKEPSCLKNPLQLLGNARLVAYLKPKAYDECPRCGVIAAKFKKSGSPRLGFLGALMGSRMLGGAEYRTMGDRTKFLSRTKSTNGRK